MVGPSLEVRVQPVRYRFLSRCCRYVDPLVCALLGLAASHPLIASGRLPLGHDAAAHLVRLMEYDSLLRQGVLIPRWAPDFIGGYGYPVFHYYPPFSNLLPELVHLAGVPFMSAMVVGMVAAFVLAALGMYLWARELLGEGPGMVAAAAYVFSPYLLLDLMTRTGLPELTALALLPLFLYVSRRYIVSPRKSYFALLTVITAAITLTHYVTAALFAPVAAVYLATQVALLRKANVDRGVIRRRSLLTGLSVILGIGLGAMYWIPTLAESSLVQLDRITLASWADYRVNFETLQKVFSYPSLSVVEPLNRIYSHNLSWIAAGLAVVGILYALCAKQPRKLAAHLVFTLIVFSVSLFMVTPVSAFIWQTVLPLQMLQFPWRFLSIAALALAWLCGFGVMACCSILGSKRTRWQPPLLAGLVAALFIYGANWQYTAAWLSPVTRASAADICSLERSFGGLGTTGTGEYLPVDVLERPPLEAACAAPRYDRLDRSSLPHGSTVLDAVASPLDSRTRLSLPESTRLVYRTFFFPGWRASVDGRLVDIFPTTPYGLISFTVPAGVHDVRLAFKSTLPRDIALAISIMSLVILLALVAWPRHSNDLDSPAGDLSTTPRQHWLTWALMIAFVGVVVVAKWTLVDPALGFYPGREAPGAVSVRFVSATSKDELVLAGLSAPETVAVGSEAQIMLYWHADAELSDDYIVTMYALDEQGNDADWPRVDQQPGHIPTSDWYPADVHRDEYSLKVPAGTPPGVYDVRIIVHPCCTSGPILDVLDGGSRAYGQAYEVVKLQVVRQRSAASLEAVQPPVRVDHAFSADLTLLGYGELPKTAVQGATIPLVLYWEAEQAPDTSLTVSIRFVDPSGRVASEVTVLPVPTYGTEEWRAGEAWRGLHQVRVPPSLVGQHALTVSLDDDRPVFLGEIDVTALPRLMVLPDVAHDTKAQFGDLVTLVGYEHSSGSHPGQPFEITLVWRVEDQTENHVKVFVHLLDAEAQVVAQHDSEPANWERPSTAWVAGEYAVDTHTLTLPAGLPVGWYAVDVGLYDSATAQRLTTASGADHLTLDQRVEVRP
jgi:hypothetical protein